jgi:hypothetical protein
VPIVCKPEPMYNQSLPPTQRIHPILRARSDIIISYLANACAGQHNHPPLMIPYMTKLLNTKLQCQCFIVTATTDTARKCPSNCSSSHTAHGSSSTYLVLIPPNISSAKTLKPAYMQPANATCILTNLRRVELDGRHLTDVAGALTLGVQAHTGCIVGCSASTGGVWSYFLRARSVGLIILGHRGALEYIRPNKKAIQ